MRDLPNLGVQCIGRRDRAEGVSIQDKKAERGFQRRPVFRGDGCVDLVDEAPLTERAIGLLEADS
jgi:hypothetical protein